MTSSADGTKWWAASEDGPIYASVDSGVTWTASSAPSNIWYSVASSADGTKLVAAGDGGVFTSTDLGATWISNNVPALQWRAVASSADGAKLVAAAGGFSDGLIFTLQATAAPRLNITLSGLNLLIAWTIPSQSFTLQQNSALTTTNWTDVTNTTALNLTNLQNQVMMAWSSSVGRFYRLKH